METEVNQPAFVPDFIATSLEEVDFALLHKKGIRYIAFDADSTLVPYRGRTLEPKLKQFLNQQRRLFKEWCIASNSLTNDLEQLTTGFKIHIIRATLFTRKPSRRFFKRVTDYFGAQPTEIAMIGDKLIADVWGAKRAGLTTVWVTKLGPDSLHDKLFGTRFLERFLMRRYGQ